MAKFNDPAAVANIYMPIIGHLKKEFFSVILLESAMEMIEDLEISRAWDTYRIFSTSVLYLGYKQDEFGL